MCEFQDLCNKNYESCKKTTEKIDIKTVGGEMQAIIKEFAEIIAPFIETLKKTYEKIYESILYTYPNRRVVWLALYHKKRRVRQKNRNRILKWINKQR